MGRLYRVGEVAALTGVSVRTLHHYDRIGLLRPSAYSEGRHRLYGERDLLCLQILTLRYLGFPLKQIARLLRQPDFDLVASMRIQRDALHERIVELQRIDAALAEVLERRLATGRWAWDLVVQASATVQDSLAQRGEAMNEKIKSYYTPEQLKQFEALAAQVTPEEIKQVEAQWPALIAEIRANLSLDPGDPAAQALAQRCDALIQATFRGNQELMAAVGENYRQGRFADVEGTPDAEVFAFIARVHAARNGTSTGEADAG